VDFVLKEDLEHRFSFAPLQGAFAAQKLAPAQITGLESMVIIRDGIVFEKSEAVLELCRQLGGVWRLAGALRVIPVSIRDYAYDKVAGNRYRWFGRKETCRLPTEAERDRFIP
jgi:predicted DCC family thiol-disulfide oxidoreductase YuxK